MFGLVLHLSYLVLEESHSDESSPGSSRTEWQTSEYLLDLGFLPIESSMGQYPGKFRIHKRQNAVVIFGRDHFKWHGYAFGKLGSTDLGEEGSDDNEYNDASDSEDEGDDPESMEDLFATGGCEAVVDSEEPVLDPRVYLLLSTQHRLETVSQS